MERGPSLNVLSPHRDSRWFGMLWNYFDAHGPASELAGKVNAMQWHESRMSSEFYLLQRMFVPHQVFGILQNWGFECEKCILHV